MTYKLPAVAVVRPENAQVLPAPEPLTVTPVPNHSVVSYGHGSNDSFVHTVSGRRLQRTVAVVMHRPVTAGLVSPAAPQDVQKKD